MPRPSGEQHVISAGATRATVTEVGATLREFVVDDVRVVWGFGEDEMCTAGRGQVLAPWPNRLGDGTYEFAGRVGVAGLNEPDRHNALHGLVCWMPWVVTHPDGSVARCTCCLAPQPAYPWWLEFRVDYAVSPGALKITTTAHNPGEETVPFALGFHPYFAPGPAGLDRSRLSLPCRRHVIVDERLLPVGAEPVEQSAVPSIATGIPLAGVRLDDDFTDLVVDPDGRWRAHFSPSGNGDVVVWGDSVFGHIQCYTADTLDPDDRRAAVAIEPMTCPPDALRSGVDIIALAPGESFQGSWGIEATGA